ncbi:MAG TPA: hypothetical protein VMT00_10485 [Thermoanaerobaculia bacterium]|nr:hypothetical protein [Thermoanaerobaculia bacterium]
MQITEPMTLATDYLLGGVALVFGLRLIGAWRREGELSIGAWGVAFLATSLAAFAGGSFHGFHAVASPPFLAVLWKTTLIAMGPASFFLGAGVVLAVTRGGIQRVVLSVLFIKSTLYIAWVMRDDDFRFVIYEYGSTMVLLLGVALWRVWSKDGWAGWAIGGVLISFAAAAVQQSGLSLHRHFNQNDLYHVIQIAALYCLYRGGLELRDKTTVRTQGGERASRARP